MCEAAATSAMRVEAPCASHRRPAGRAGRSGDPHLARALAPAVVTGQSVTQSTSLLLIVQVVALATREYRGVTWPSDPPVAPTCGWLPWRSPAHNAQRTTAPPTTRTPGSALRAHTPEHHGLSRHITGRLNRLLRPWGGSRPRRRLGRLKGTQRETLLKESHAAKARLYFTF